jgi:hypothetical protein
MRSLLVIALLALTGCALSPPPLPVQPDAPTKESVVTTLGKDLDKTDHRVASALVAIERNADKPKVVVAESRLAQSYLPAPPENDVAFSMARAAKGDELDYKKQMEFGRKLATAVTLAWDKLEADQKRALEVSQLKDRRIVELTAEVERVEKDAAANLWTMAAVGTAVLGALAMAFAGPRIGISLLASAAAIGAFPFVVDSEYFTIIAGCTLALAAAIGLWVIWDKARDQVHKSDEQPPPKV